ncbi:MAG: transposase [Gammaproteobacteria bacterium]|nr:transposase [Gammaproteobacteria bacterium]
MPGKQDDSDRNAGNNRQFVKAVVWIGKNGAKWCSLPSAYARWSGVHRHFKRRADKGVWQCNTRACCGVVCCFFSFELCGFRLLRAVGVKKRFFSVWLQLGGVAYRLATI